MPVEAPAKKINDVVDVAKVISVAEHQFSGLITAHAGQVPMYTQEGHWYFGESPWAKVWTAGFLAGSLYVLGDLTGDSNWTDAGIRYTGSINAKDLTAGIHDIGFLFSPSWGRLHDADPSAVTRDQLICAGRIMASYYNSAGHYLRTWVSPGSTFIDVMMELDIIFRSAALTDDKGLADVALEHARTSRRFLVRGDDTTVHEGIFDPNTGEFLHASTHQGTRSDSSWARGLAWAVYGFAHTFSWSGEGEFLATSRRLADKYMHEVGNKYITQNDWTETTPQYRYDASAAAIMAAGLLRLADFTPRAESAIYREYALQIVATLSGPEFLEDGVSGREGLIKHAIYHERVDIGVDQSVMWGDYYFLEALHRLVCLDEI